MLHLYKVSRHRGFRITSADGASVFVDPGSELTAGFATRARQEVNDICRATCDEMFNAVLFFGGVADESVCLSYDLCRMCSVGRGRTQWGHPFFLLVVSWRCLHAPVCRGCCVLWSGQKEVG